MGPVDSGRPNRCGRKAALSPGLGAPQAAFGTGHRQSASSRAAVCLGILFSPSEAPRKLTREIHSSSALRRVPALPPASEPFEKGAASHAYRRLLSSPRGLRNNR